MVGDGPSSQKPNNHDDVIKWKHFPRYWPLSPVNSPHKGQWRGALMFSLICVWMNGWVNNREAGDLRRHHPHYDVIVMVQKAFQCYDVMISFAYFWTKMAITYHSIPLQWRHKWCDGLSNYQPHDCLLNSLFRRISKKTSKLRVTGLCVGNSSVTGEFPTQMASNAENVSIWWRHHAMSKLNVVWISFDLTWAYPINIPNYSKSINHYWLGFRDTLVLSMLQWRVNSLRPRLNRRPFTDDIFKCIFLNENEWVLPRISLKFVPKVRINNIPVLVQIMAWRRPGDKPLSEPMMASFLTHICVTRPQWVKPMEARLIGAYVRVYFWRPGTPFIIMDTS